MAENKPQFSFSRVASKSKLLSALAIGALMTASLAVAGGISNIRASQRTGASLVDIRYDLDTSETNGMLVAVAVSTNGGNSFDLPATHSTGDVGFGVMAGTNKWIVWDALLDWPDRFSTNIFFRLAASDAPVGMALIPAGSFQMGDSLDDDTNAPVHTVNVSGFYMDKNLVTKALWDEVYQWAMGQGYSFDAGLGKGATHPIQAVSWHDVVKWCNARSEKERRVPAYYTDAGLSVRYRSGQVAPYVNWSSGYRLPTEAEWEKAARGGLSGKRFPWGDTITHSQANYYSDSYYAYDISPTRGDHPSYAQGDYPYTSPVGAFAANGYGLYDMAGNVFEWCWDRYGIYGSGLQSDPRGPASGSYRVFRGGNWLNIAWYCRAAYRCDYWPDYRYYNIGFRSVLPPGQP